MLPDKVHSTLQSFIVARDMKHPPGNQFREAEQTILSRSNMGGFGASQLRNIAEEYCKILHGRTEFVWEKLKEIVQTLGVEPFPTLVFDLQGVVESQCDPAFQLAKRKWEELAKRARIKPSDFALRIQPQYRAVMVRTAAEIDLFGTNYLMSNKSSPPIPNQATTYNLSGPNSRVYVGSSDSSINVNNSGQIFTELRKTIEANVTDITLRDQLVAKSHELETNVGQKSFLNKYSEFIALAANHIQVISPFVPALTGLLSK